MEQRETDVTGFEGTSGFCMIHNFIQRTQRVHISVQLQSAQDILLMSNWYDILAGQIAFLEQLSNCYTIPAGGIAFLEQLLLSKHLVKMYMIIITMISIWKIMLDQTFIHFGYILEGVLVGRRALSWVGRWVRLKEGKFQIWICPIPSPPININTNRH